MQALSYQAIANSLALLLLTLAGTAGDEHAAAKRVVAMLPCVAGPKTSAEVAQAITAIALDVAKTVPDVQLLDRSSFKQVMSEQDLWLVSNTADTASIRFGAVGAQEILIIALFRAPGGYMLHIRLLAVPTGELRQSSIRSAPTEAGLLHLVPGWLRSFWQSEVRVEPRSKTSETTIGIIWKELDNPEARRLLGRHLDRAESAFRQYKQIVETGSAEEVDRLEPVVAIYLVDCFSVLQRIHNPPEGMVYVPPGRVSVDFPPGPEHRFEQEGFFIDRCEYTRRQYAAFLDATGREKPLGWLPPGEGTADRPITGMNWFDAEAVAQWRGMRLPSYTEHLLAATGGDSRRYPWGDSWQQELCVCLEPSFPPALQPVNACPNGASPSGAVNLVGNVWEWLDVWHVPAYWKTAPLRNPSGPASGSAKLVVGGSFRSGQNQCFCGNFQALTPGTQRDDIGFRCVLRLTAGARHRMGVGSEIDVQFR